MQLVHHAAPAESRHLDVGEDEVYLTHFLSGNSESHGAVGRFENAIAGLRENALAQFPQRLFVINQQDCFSSRRRPVL